MTTAWTILCSQILIYGFAWMVAARVITKYQETSLGLALSAMCFGASLIVIVFAGGLIDDALRYGFANALKIQGFLYFGNAIASFYHLKTMAHGRSWLFSLLIGLLFELLSALPGAAYGRQTYAELANGIILGVTLLRIRVPFRQEYGKRAEQWVLGCGYVMAAIYILKSLWHASSPGAALLETDAVSLVNDVMAFSLLIGNATLYLGTTLLFGVRLLRESSELSLRDPLTGLLNRRGLENEFQHLHSRYLRSGSSYAIAILDIDHFKTVNDTLGHAAGDHILQQIGIQLETTLRSVDTPSRLGGEEFVLLLPDTPHDEAFKISERLRKHIADHPFAWKGQPVKVTVSIGLSQVQTDTNTLHELLEKADQALYQAKNDGRNRVVAIWNA